MSTIFAQPGEQRRFLLLSEAACAVFAPGIIVCS